MAGAEVRRIGFLGAGKMATALARGWLAARLASSDRLLASDPVPQAREAASQCAPAAALALLASSIPMPLVQRVAIN